MASHRKVRNLTHKCDLDYKQAVKRVEAGTAAWEEEGVSFHMLTPREVLENRRNQMQVVAEYGVYGEYRWPRSLPPAEVENVTWDPPQRERYTQAPRRELIKEALKFAKNPEAYALNSSGFEQSL